MSCGSEGSICGSSESPSLHLDSLEAEEVRELDLNSNYTETSALREGLSDSSHRVRAALTRKALRASLLDQALQFANGGEYRRVEQLQEEFMGQRDRNVERDSIQREANRALQRTDCHVANFADYVAYEIEERHEGDAGLELPELGDEYPITSPRKLGVIEELITHGMSPAEVAKLSDVFEHPSCLKKVDLSLIPWLQQQSEMGYWRNHASLFILCLTIAMSVGSVETIFKLNATWDGMTFLIPYFLSYVLVVQPIICFELTTGQVHRGGLSTMYERLMGGCGGVGTAIVILCIVSGCLACGLSSAEYMLYVVDAFRSKIPWKLAESDIMKCSGANELEKCRSMGPLCHFVDGECVASAIGKAYLAYQERFDPGEGTNSLDGELVWGMGVTYSIVTILQMAGLTRFTFPASILIILVFFLTHMQLCATIVLDGATTYIWDSFRGLDWSTLFATSRIWSHPLRCCLYEYIVGSGIYSTLASKCRVGYDCSAEAVGIGVFSGYVTMLMFVTACSLIGYYSKLLKTVPSDIIWMLEQDCSYILLPLGFQATDNMERTLCVLQFGCCAILLCATLAVQVEVAVSNIKDSQIPGINKVDRRWISLILCILLMLFSLLLTSKRGKTAVWFMEIAVGDLGRVFVVLLTTVVVGWFYGLNAQIAALGKPCIFSFNGVFWCFNLIFSLCEVCDETLPPIIWWVGRLLGLTLATIVALAIFKKQKSRTPKGYANTLWWLFFGNVEQLRFEICRVTPMDKVSNLPLRIFWSFCMKWAAPCMLSSTMADILEELISDNRLNVNITDIPKEWKWITLALWSGLVAIVILVPIVRLFWPKKKNADFLTVDFKDLPACPRYGSIISLLFPSYIFKEFYRTKTD